MRKDVILKKRCIVTLSGDALEKISALPARSISQYAREAILEKAQRETIVQTNNYNNELTTQIARLAAAIEKLSTAISTIPINSGSVPAQTVSAPQVTEQVIDDAEHARLFDEMLINMAADIINNGWGNAGDGKE